MIRQVEPAGDALEYLKVGDLTLAAHDLADAALGEAGRGAEAYLTGSRVFDSEGEQSRYVTFLEYLASFFPVPNPNRDMNRLECVPVHPLTPAFCLEVVVHRRRPRPYIPRWYIRGE
ncbi:hypothetical protein TBS_21570 [Thermobispora bispora]